MSKSTSRAPRGAAKARASTKASKRKSPRTRRDVIPAPMGPAAASRAMRTWMMCGGTPWLFMKLAEESRRIADAQGEALRLMKNLVLDWEFEPAVEALETMTECAEAMARRKPGTGWSCPVESRLRPLLERLAALDEAQWAVVADAVYGEIGHGFDHRIAQIARVLSVRPPRAEPDA